MAKASVLWLLEGWGLGFRIYGLEFRKKGLGVSEGMGMGLSRPVEITL